MEPRGWSRHGFSIGMDLTGHGEARWRAYKGCADDPTPPCDEIVGNVVTGGGWASVLFYHLDGQTAAGVVIGSAESDVLALGPVTLTLQTYGMATLEPMGRGIGLCGPDYLELAPASLRIQAPCGA